jgi:hypothetical protein
MSDFRQASGDEFSIDFDPADDDSTRSPRKAGGSSVRTAVAIGLSTLASQTSAEPMHSPDETVWKPVAGEVRPARSMAAELRDAQRGLALQVLAPNREALLGERVGLLGLKRNGQLSADDARRLEYVRWQLHQIEEAETGPSLDSLEKLADLHEQLASTIDQYIDQTGLRRKKRRR